MPYSLPTGFNDEYEKADGEAVEGQGQEYQRVQPGMYIARIIKPNRKVINDKQVLEPAFEILADGEGGATEEQGKHTLSKPFYLNPKAIWKFAGLLKCLNITVSDPQVFYDNVILNRTARVQIVEEFYTRKDGTQGSKTVVSNISKLSGIEGLENNPRDASEEKWEAYEIVEEAAEEIETLPVPEGSESNLPF